MGRKTASSSTETPTSSSSTSTSPSTTTKSPGKRATQQNQNKPPTSGRPQKMSTQHTVISVSIPVSQKLTDEQIQQIKDHNHQRVRRIITAVSVVLIAIAIVLVALSLSLGPKIDELVTSNSMADDRLSSKDLFFAAGTMDHRNNDSDVSALNESSSKPLLRQERSLADELFYQLRPT